MADRLDDRLDDRMVDRLDDRMVDRMVHPMGGPMVARGRADHLDDHLQRNRGGHAEGRQRPRLVGLLSDRVDPFQEGLLEGHRNRV